MDISDLNANASMTPWIVMLEGILSCEKHPERYPYSRIITAVERPCAFFKRMILLHLMVTTVPRVRVKTYYTAMSYKTPRSTALNCT
jgi:hypothetical protein